MTEVTPAPAPDALAELAGVGAEVSGEERDNAVAALKNGIVELVRLLPRLRPVLDQVEAHEARMRQAVAEEVSAAFGLIDHRLTELQSGDPALAAAATAPPTVEPAAQPAAEPVAVDAAPAIEPAAALPPAVSADDVVDGQAPDTYGADPPLGAH